MQITPVVVSNSLLQTLQNQEAQINQLQQEVATGQSFQLPSDNPIAAETTLGLNNSLAQINTFTTAAQNAQGWLTQASGSLSGMVSLWDQALQTATQATNSSNNQSDLNSMASAVNELQANLGQILNSQYEGNYIFNGFQSQTAPIPVTGNSYPPSVNWSTTTNGQSQTFQVDTTASVTVNLTGWESVGQTAGQNYLAQAYNDLGFLATAIKQGPAAVNTLMPQLQQDLSNLTGAQALVGGRMQRVQNTLGQLQQASSDLTQSIANVAGANMAQVTTQLAQEQVAYQAALQSGSKILSLSLLNFINP